VDLFVADLDTNERWPLVAGPERESDARWSPDGRTVVYQDGTGLWALPVSGGRPSGSSSFLRRGAHSASVWTEHGYYYNVRNTVSRARQLPLDREGTGARGPLEPFPLPAVDLSNLYVSWSPDGSTAAVAGCCDGQIHLTDGRSTSTIPLAPDLNPSTLWWSADGKEILFAARTTRRRDPATRTLRSVEVSSGAGRELFPPVPALQLRHPHMSPDGEHMVFIRGWTDLVLAEVGHTDGLLLATVNEHGRPANRLGQPRFSPDGSRVAFMRGHDGASTTLWVVDSDGRDERLLVATDPVARVLMEIAWHPDGSKIAYREYDGGRSELWVVSAEDGTKHEIEGLDPANDYHLLSWSPDGSALIVHESTGRTELWVTQDLLGEPGWGKSWGRGGTNGAAADAPTGWRR
jgi:Tol biopolymer transport system component